MKRKTESLLAWLKRPYGWGLALVYVATVVSIAAALTLVIIASADVFLQVLSYISYCLAALTLAYSVYTIVIYAPSMKNRFISFMRKNAFVSRLLDNWGYRTVVFAGVSLFINVAYVAFNGVIAILSRSIWYGALAAYYILLTALRSGIVLYHRKRAKGKFYFKQNAIDSTFSEQTQFKITELKKYRACGVLLIVLPVSLSFAILQMVVAGSAFIHYGWIIYAVAAYAFYKITMAIINIFKARNTDEMTVRALRCVSLADAMVSILALQTTLLFAFSDGAATGFANALTGGVVCALTVVLGAYMIINANKKLKKIRTNIG
ncbi:MAG: hypothetical protein IJW47_00295 [Clostridia bacterium]|nr:hypothetical protein [Clostridia bacterium]